MNKDEIKRSVKFIKKLVKKLPNDFDLGEAVRKFINSKKYEQLES